MAINTQKLLPPSKLTTAERMSASYDRRIDDILNFEIKEKLIDVDKFFKNKKKKDEKKAKKKKEGKKRKERDEREKKLETPKGIKGVEKVKSLIPSTGILNAVQRFATFTFLGYLLGKFGGETPKLLGILKNVGPVINTTEKIIGGIFEGIVGFIDAGYKAHDQMRILSKDIGGEKAQKVYDDFSANFNRFLNAVLTFGLSELGRGGEKPPEKKSGGGMVRGYQRGGQTTRGGQVVGSAVRRTFKAQRVQRPQRVQPEKVSPGKDVGGKLKIEKLYPNPKPSAKKSPNPYKALTGVSESLDKGGWIGALMSAGVKVALGQKVNVRRIASTVSSGVGSLSQAQSGGLDVVSRSILGMADGGLVPSSEKNTKMMSGLLATLIQTRVNEALKSVTDELLKVPGGAGGGAGGGEGGDEGIGGGPGGYNKTSENYVAPEEIYAYLKGKGLSHNHILGILANIKAESSFDSGAIGDSGTSGGLFQHHASRFDGMVAFAGKDWAKKWQRQVDYALREDAGKEYVNKQFESAAAASTWFTLNFEKPSNAEQKARVRLDNLEDFGPDGSVKVSKTKGKIIEYLTGDRSFSVGYDEAHGGGNYHEHLAFATKEDRDAAMRLLRSKGYEIGSINTGTHADGSLHYQDKAFDVPFYPNDKLLNYSDDREGEQRFSRDVRNILSNGGFYGSGIKPPKPKPESKPEQTKKQTEAQKKLQSSLKKARDEEKFRSQRPWYDKFGLFGGAAAKSPKPKPKPKPGAAAVLGMPYGGNMQGGGLVGPQNKRNYSPLSMYPSYDTPGGTTILIQPMIVEKQIPVPMGSSGQAIAFPVPVGVNNNMASLSR